MDKDGDDVIIVRVMKKRGNIIKAYQLGKMGAEVRKLMDEHKIIDIGGGKFEVMSREAVQGGSGHGQVAELEDYIKIDGGGYPYPNDRKYFKKNHKYIAGDEYEQIPRPLLAWTAEEEISPEITFLIEKKGLILDENSKENYFNAILWETKESAPRDSILVFYSIDHDDQGNIMDATFNFVVREEFDQNYRFC